jgi:hypothetical protein
MQVVVQRNSAWAAQRDGGAIETPEAWSQWAAAPEALGHEGQPEVKFLPAGVRRRATRLTRMMLQVAFDATEGIDRGAVRTVFASRHGAIHVAVRILASIAKQELVSPLQFSHSVHNAQAGLFSIAAGNREASSSIAAEADTFGHGFLEALLHLERSPHPVLLVMADEPLPSNLAHLVEEPEGAYAVGLLLTREGEGPRLEFSLAATQETVAPRVWPDAIEFVRFLEQAEPELTLGHGRRRWCWKRNS